MRSSWLRRRELALSPCGKYFYERLQDAAEIELRRLNGEVWRLPLPPWEGNHPPIPDHPTNMTFVGLDRVLATTLFEGGTLRRVLIDLRADSPVVID
jgi:hypothetical protein